MIRDHRFFEIQSALAAAGQLTDAELRELEQHAATCVSCRECLADMAQLSRELFLMQALKRKSHRTPAGMRNRFFERAKSAGIAVNPSTSAPLDLRFARVALIAVLLAIGASLSWKAFSTAGPGRTATPDSTIAEVPSVPASKAPPPIGEERVIHGVPADKVPFRRRSIVRRSVVSMSPAPAGKEEPESHFVPSRPFLSAGFHALPSASLLSAYVGRCFEHEEGCKPEESAFHLQLNLASLSFLGPPQNAREETPTGSMRFNAPPFHLGPQQVW